MKQFITKRIVIAAGISILTISLGVSTALLTPQAPKHVQSSQSGSPSVNSAEGTPTVKDDTAAPSDASTSTGTAPTSTSGTTAATSGGTSAPAATEPAPAPAPTLTSQHLRWVKSISNKFGAGSPHYDFYCDRGYSDGTTTSPWIGSVDIYLRDVAPDGGPGGMGIPSGCEDM